MAELLISARQTTLEAQWRDEDLRHREVLEARRVVDDRRRAVDEKAEQLRAIGSISALLAGVAVVVLTNVQFPLDLEPPLVVISGALAAVVICCTLLCTLTSTYLLVALYRFDCTVPQRQFIEGFWKIYCEAHWYVCFRLFTTGVVLFVVLVGLIGSVVFFEGDSRLITSSLIGFVAVVTLIYAMGGLMYKWNDYLVKLNP